MSRIIRGKSEDVQAMKIAPPKPSAGQPMNQVQFRVMHSAGMLSRAEAEAEAKRAAQVARAEGMKEAEQRLKAPLMTAMENLNSVLDELSKFRRELFKECEQELIELLRFMGKKVLNRELSLNPELLHELVEKALEEMHKEKEIEIRLNPKDLEAFRSAKSDLMESHQASIRILGDQDVPAAAAVISTKSKQIETQLEKVIDSLLDRAIEQKAAVTETGDEGDKV